ncbi:MarR family transcriptional regulator [Kallotenue papyrolyticum]|uniref:MarR family transcriptional regulator n=1 Tax=Kallotenue papyrolyticum TaxID=1325125 RepID=UPI000478559C|nr:MarR family transcriptional regulator [Kallotenue papyrolyticum]
MTEVQLGPTAQRVINFLQQHRADRFTPEELAEHLDCTPQEVRAALHTLEERNLVERSKVAGASEVYSLRR